MTMRGQPLIPFAASRQGRFMLAGHIFRVVNLVSADAAVRDTAHIPPNFFPVLAHFFYFFIAPAIFSTASGFSTAFIAASFAEIIVKGSNPTTPGAQTIPTSAQFGSYFANAQKPTTTNTAVHVATKPQYMHRRAVDGLPEDPIKYSAIFAIIYPPIF
jgi:hypothetical protein